MQDLIKQLKNIDITARTEWKVETRSFLLAQIMQDRSTIKGLSKKERIINTCTQMARNLKMVKLAWRPAGILAGAFLFLMLGSGALMAAAQNAVPGEKCL